MNDMLNVLTVNWAKGLIRRVGDPKKKNIPFHTDAAQSCGKIEVDVEKLQVDLLTIAGHKITHQRVWVLSMLERELPSITLSTKLERRGKESGY